MSGKVLPHGGLRKKTNSARQVMQNDLSDLSAGVPVNPGSAGTEMEES